MKLRLLIAAALVACVARATPIVQTLTYGSGGSYVSYNQSGVGTLWNPTPYDASNGPLKSVSLLWLVEASVTAIEINPFDIPMLVSPGSRLTSRAYVLDPMAFGPEMVGTTSYVAAPSTLVPPFSPGPVFTSNFAQSLQVTITDPDTLSLFTMPGFMINLVSRSVSDESWGFQGMSATFNATLIYNAPDSGSTVLLLAAAVTGLWFVHRRVTAARACQR